MMFQVGQLLAPSVALTCLYLELSPELTWRLCLGTGSALAFLGTILRAGTMQESQAWLDTRATARISGVIGSWNVLRAIGYPLAGTMSTYFLYDVVSWGVGSYTSSIFESSTHKGTLWYMLLINA